ncbi:TIGR04222 domain-containing membrane protein [Geodermatophilus sp. SYSU D01176]
MGGRTSDTAARLDVYEVAHLAGGPARVVDTAVVVLVRSGRVRVHAPGELATAELTRRHPVEAAVLDAIGPTGHRTVETVRWRLAGDERIGNLARRLQQEGLLRPRGLGALPRREAAPVSPTRSGRRLLARLREERGAVDEPWRVALGGRAAMQDHRLRAAVFEPPQAERDVGRRSIRAARRELAAQDPTLSARYTFGTAAGSAAVVGFGDGGFADGGGGGDGGG